MPGQDDATSHRRGFLKAGAATLLAAGSGTVHAGGREEIKVGVVGCGGRGKGAMVNALQADERVRIVAVADVFDQGEKGTHTALEQLQSRGFELDRDHVFVGFEAYRKLLKLDLDYVILATPPHFRPEHIRAAVEAGKNIFAEKPVAVDPPGARLVMQAGQIAAQKKLTFVAGTHRRHQATYREAYQRIRDGAIGRLLAARCYRNGGELWYRSRTDPRFPQYASCSDMELMLRDWVNWCWLSGDHIVEQHIHNLDVVNWFLSPDGSAAHPVRAVGMGGRARRVTGDQFDFFAVDFEYPEGVHVASYCRQINDCDRQIAETVVGEKGTSDCCTQITGPNPWSWPRRKEYANPYVQEHVDLIASLTGKGDYLNEAGNVAISSMTAIMGRIAAYTGRPVTWDEVMSSDLALGPPQYAWDLPLFPAGPPVPGRA